MGTVQIDNNNNTANVPDPSSTEDSTMETDNKLGTVTENIDPFGTATANTDPFGTGTEQTFLEDSVVGTEPTPLLTQEYTSESNQAVASIQDNEADTQDINEVLTDHQQPLNEPARNQRHEDFKTGTAQTDDQSGMNIITDNQTTDAGLPNGTIATSTVPTDGENLISHEYRCPVVPDELGTETDHSQQSVSNEQRDVNNNVVLETDSEHTSGCSTCAHSSSTSSCETDCSKCRQDTKINGNCKKKLVKKGKKRKNSDDSYSSGSDSNSCTPPTHTHNRKVGENYVKL